MSNNIKYTNRSTGDDVTNKYPCSFIYCIKKNNDGPYKIGVSNQPYTRARHFDIWFNSCFTTWNNGSFIYDGGITISVPHAEKYRLEKVCHPAFKNNNITGEWFDLKHLSRAKIEQKMKTAIYEDCCSIEGWV